MNMATSTGSECCARVLWVARPDKKLAAAALRTAGSSNDFNESSRVPDEAEPNKEEVNSKKLGERELGLSLTSKKPHFANIEVVLLWYILAQSR
jgi:hypothetical protein